ncbi:MAG TPA: MauE/DoxX family redox-associated membrane protein [Pseudonocardia sp.]|nr:MauE/DoxX family redox-associated membrane protein [Pseudonocardia sp.]
MSAVQLWCAGVVAGVFAVSAVVKFRDPVSFRAGVRAFRLLPDRAVAPVARIVPPLEAAAAVLVLVPLTRTAGFVLAAALLLAFAAGMLGVLRRGAVASCACFGRSSRPVAPRHVVRNVVLTIVCAAGVITGGAPLSPAAALLALLAAFPAVAVVVSLDDIADLFAPAPPPPASTGSRHP